MALRIYIAHLETRSFDFEAIGITEEEAKRGVRRAWQRWRSLCKQRGEDISGMYRWTDLADDVGIREMETGKYYMDREELS